MKASLGVNLSDMKPTRIVAVRTSFTGLMARWMKGLMNNEYDVHQGNSTYVQLAANEWPP